MTFMLTGIGHNSNNGFGAHTLFVVKRLERSTVECEWQQSIAQRPGIKAVIWSIRLNVLVKHHAGSEWSLYEGCCLQAHLHALTNAVYIAHTAL